jgi:hypothetical protein
MATASVIAVVTGLGLGACESTDPIPTPSPSQVIGTWTHGNTSLEFDQDGAFLITNIPTGVIEQRAIAAGGSPVGPNVDVSGSWHIGSGGNDVGGAPGVQLDFVHPARVGPNTGLTLVVSGNYPPKLFVYLGNPDTRVQYAFTKH